MKKIFAVCVLVLGVCGCATVDGKRETRIFDGKSFAGWEGDTNKTFKIVDGAIVGGTLKEKIPRNEFLCTTRNYTNFVLKLKFKLVGEGANAGVQFRAGGKTVVAGACAHVGCNGQARVRVKRCTECDLRLEAQV